MAQDYSATHLDTTWAAGNARPTFLVEIQWDGTNWVDETANCLAVESITHSLLGTSGLALIGGGEPSAAALLMENQDNRFSPDNASSPIHAHIAGGIYLVPVRISGGYYYGATPERLRQFTGYIMAATEAQVGEVRTVRFACMGPEAVIRQHKDRTAILRDYRADQVIDAYLDLPTSPAVTHSEDYAHAIIPWSALDDENIWQQVQEVAASDGGWVYATKEGAIVYERMTHWVEGLEHTASQATLADGASGHLVRLEDSIGWRDLYTDIIVPYQARDVGVIEVVYQSHEPIEIPPGATKTIVAKFDWLATGIVAPVAGVDYHAVTAGMQDCRDDLTVTVTAYGKQADVELVNGNANQTLYVLGLQLRGYPLMGGDMRQVEYAATAGAIGGKKEWREPDNYYRQTEIQAERIGGWKRDLLQRPRRRLVCHLDAACPWLELGDRVHVTHHTATSNPGIDTDCYVLAMQQSYSAAQITWKQQLVVVPVTDFWGESAYFVLGVDEYADSGATPIFY